MVFYRSVVALTLPVPNMLLTRPRSLLRPRRIGIHIVRAIIGNLGMAYVFWAHALLPMADATALLFASPLFVAALSPPLIGEKVDGSRWVAVVSGFAGIFLITRPSPALVAHPAVLVGLAAVLADITLRKLGRTDAPLTTVFYFLLIGVILTAPFTLAAGDPPPGHLISWLLGIGVFPPYNRWPRPRPTVWRKSRG